MFTKKRIGLTKWGKPWLRYEKKGFEVFEQKGAGRPHLRDGKDQSFRGCSGRFRKEARYVLPMQPETYLYIMLQWSRH